MKASKTMEDMMLSEDRGIREILVTTNMSDREAYSLQRVLSSAIYPNQPELADRDKSVAAKLLGLLRGVNGLE